MKKNLILIACLIIAGQVFAQENIPNQKKFIFGAKVGLNVSNMVGDAVSDGVKPKAGINVGLVGEYRVNKLFAIAPEILFSMQGIKENDGNSKTSINSNYINIPIMARFYLLEALSIEVGPQFGFATSIIAKVEENDVKLAMQYDPEAYNLLDFALGIGATYNHQHKVFVSARYNIGLTNIFKYTEGANRNSVFQLSVGYNF